MKARAKSRRTKPVEVTPAIDLFRPSINAFKLNYPTFILTYVLSLFAFLFAVLVALDSWVSQWFQNNQGDIKLAPADWKSIVIAVLIFTLALGYINSMLYVTKLASVAGNQVKFREVLVAAYYFYPRVLALGLIRGIAIVIGLVCFIYPGLYIWRSMLMAPYLMLDRDLSIRQAIRQSYEVSTYRQNKLWQMGWAYVLIALAGGIPFIGYILGPILNLCYYCAAAIRYEEIKHLA